MLEVMRDILQSRYLRSNVAHKQLARTSLITAVDLFTNTVAILNILFQIAIMGFSGANAY